MFFAELVLYLKCLPSEEHYYGALGGDGIVLVILAFMILNWKLVIFYGLFSYI